MHEISTTIFLILFITVILTILLSIINNSKRNIYKYKKKPNLLTDHELTFYRELIPVASKKGFTVFAKVRLADLIEPYNRKNWQSSFNKICSKHIDFVLCENINIKPVLLIELDDRTHDRPDRKKRDIFVDQAVKSANLPILHTRTAQNLDKQISLAIK